MQFARPLPGHHAFCMLLAICPPNWGSCPLGGAGEIGGGMTLEQLVEHYLKQVLTQTRRALDAAEILGVDQAEIYRKK